MQVLFVCLGNICRSPSAEGVFRALCEQRGSGESIGCDSAGTGSWHVGKAPDHRAQQAALRRGLDLSALRARQLAADDFHRFDHIVAMDKDNLQTLRAMAPEGAEGKLRLLLDYGAYTPHLEVPDPYYGGMEGFDQMLDLIELGCAALLDACEQGR